MFVYDGGEIMAGYRWALVAVATLWLVVGRGLLQMVLVGRRWSYDLVMPENVSSNKENNSTVREKQKKKHSRKAT